MSEQSFFFDSEGGDRRYDAADWAAYFSAFVGNGVWAGGLEITADTGMGLSLSTGKAYIDGYMYYNTAALTVTIPAADATYPRIDRVVVRFDSAGRQITTEVISGTPAAVPSAPALTRTSLVYELCVAQVHVSAGATYLEAGNITDKRQDASLCGIVASSITPLDSTAVATARDAAEAAQEAAEEARDDAEEAKDDAETALSFVQAINDSLVRCTQTEYDALTAIAGTLYFAAEDE